MLVPSCEGGRSWSSEIWLLLALISNASGLVLAFSRFFECPWSWLASMACINTYRLIFNVKPTMPILLDTGFSLFLQWVVSAGGEQGLRWAVSMAFLVIERAFYSCYFSPLLDEHVRLRKLCPESKPLVAIISPLSPLHFGMAMLQIYFLNGCVLLVAWFWQRDGMLYGFYENSVGVMLLWESYVFLSCYKRTGSKKEEASSQGRLTTM